MITKAIERILLWLVARKLRAHHREAARGPTKPLRFPFELGAEIASVRSRIQDAYASDSALDHPIRGIDGHHWRTYELENPGGASVNVRYGYRTADGTVWSIRVAYADPVFSGQVGKVSLNANVMEVRRILGPATETKPPAFLRQAELWLLADVGYRIDTYAETNDDIGGYNAAGQIDSIEWFLRSAAPPGYVAHFADY